MAKPVLTMDQLNRILNTYHPAHRRTENMIQAAFDLGCRTQAQRDAEIATEHAVHGNPCTTVAEAIETEAGL